MMQQRSGHGVVRADIHFFDVRGLDVVLVNQAQHFSHGRVRQRSGRMRLDRDAGISQRPGLAEAADDRVRIEAAAFGLKESERRFQNIVGGGPAERGEIGGDGAVFRGVPGLKRLGHGAEIVAEAAAFGGADADRVDRLQHVQAAQAARRPRCCRRCRTFPWNESLRRSGAARWPRRFCVSTSTPM